jgi:carboxyl-terminal processing protease
MLAAASAAARFGQHFPMTDPLNPGEAPQSGEAPAPVPVIVAPPPPPAVRFSPPKSGVPRTLVAVLAPVLAIVMFTAGLATGQAITSPTLAPPSVAEGSPYPSDAEAQLALIVQAWHELQDNYVDAKTLDNQALAYAAIRGMTDAIGDTGHTMFFSAAESKAMDQSLSGTFVGIGVQVVSVDATAGTGVKIGVLIPKTPAEEAGLRRGDVVLKVDGSDVTTLATDAIVSKIRGPEGTSVTLTIQRAGVADFDLTITRRKFDLPLSSWAMVPGQDVAVVRLDSFASGGGKAVTEAIEAAKKAGAKGIILDLRGNPGGYVTEAVAVASQFVPDGIVYQATDRSGATTENKVTPGGLWTKGPLVVLANADSASAAEIVIGAIKDAGRAKVVGVKTFGTGTVLGRFDLADGSSLRIGIERWLTRNGQPIWHQGISPDVVVDLAATAVQLYPNDLQDLTPAQLAASTDAQFLKAIEVLKAEE